MMILQSLQRSLPKPALFALYGAAGALLGGLIFGEALWAALRPPAAKAPGPVLRVAVSPEVTMDQGSKNSFEVVIGRERFAGAVKLRFNNPPGGVTFSEATIAPGETKAKIESAASSTAVVGNHRVSVVASWSDDPTVSDEAVVALKLNPFIGSPSPKVDVMFVLDVTGSMGFAIKGVREGIQDFAKELEERQLDSRVGLIAYGDRLIDEEPKVLSFDGDSFTKDLAEFRRQVAAIKLSGGGDIPESSLDALALASRQPFRRDAAKVLLLITDAPPQVPDMEMTTVEQTATTLTQHEISQLHLVVRREHRTIYEKIQKGSKGGEYFDLRSAATGSAGFAAILPNVSREIARITIASQAAPAVPQASAAPVPALKAVQSEEAFDAGSSGRLILAFSVWSAVVAAGICWLIVFGQNYYLKQSWLSPQATASAVGGGAIAGLLGGAAGQYLALAAADGGGSDTGMRILGWTILGGVAGSGIALFVPNLKLAKGLLGGAIGGAVGSAGYIIAVALLKTLGIGEVGGRLLGVVLVGLFIGLMVALAERAFRHAWIEVHYGPKESRIINLGPEPVSIGGDSRSCTVWARGAAPIAARFQIRDKKVLFTDAVSGVAADVNHGFRKQIGGVEVVVHTGGQQVAQASTPSKAPPPPPPPKPKPPAAVKPKPAAAAQSTAAPTTTTTSGPAVARPTLVATPVETPVPAKPRSELPAQTGAPKKPSPPPPPPPRKPS